MAVGRATVSGKAAEGAAGSAGSGMRARLRRERDSKLARGIACAVVGGAFWGFSGNCASFLFEGFGVDTFWLMCARQLLAGVLFIAFGLATDRTRLFALWTCGRDMLHILVFAFCGLLFNQFCYLKAIDTTNAGTATVLMCLQLAVIMAYSCIRARRAPRRREALGLVLALLGTFLIATGGNPASLSISPLGLAFGLGSALGGALLAIVPLSLLPKYGTPAVTGSAMLVAGVALCPAVQPWAHMPAMDGSGWAVFGLFVVVGSFLAYLLYMQGVADLGSVRASMLATSEPIAATLISVAWMGVVFAPTDLVGLVCIVAMMFLVV